MIATLHGVSTMPGNLVTDVRIAQETGYEALEILVDKLLRYLDEGLAPEDLIPVFEAHAIRPVVLNALHAVDRIDPKEQKALLAEAERLATVAEALGCPTFQVTFSERLAGRPWSEVRRLAAKNVARVADIGKEHGVGFQVEPIAWSPIASLARSLEVIDEAGRDNVAMVIDFWHLYAGGETAPEEVAELHPSRIVGVHLCDGIARREGEEWNKFVQRGYLPGDGEMRVKEWVDAVLSTGFDGVWSVELVSPKHWEWDLWEVARECRQRMDRYV